jgi:hypothetical protein
MNAAVSIVLAADACACVHPDPRHYRL